VTLQLTLSAIGLVLGIGGSVVLAFSMSLLSTYLPYLSYDW